MEPISDRDFVVGWRARQARRAQAADEWRDARRAELAEAVRRLAAFAGVTRIAVFGSLARGSAIPGSDIDLWIEGLAETDWLAAIDAVRAVVRDAEVDLVRAEWAGPAFAEHALRGGTVLYER